MTLHRYAKARDENEPQIVRTLQAAGYSVYRLDVPCDLLVGRGRTTHLVEVKRAPGLRGGLSGRELTPTQRDFLDTWKGCYHLVSDGLELITQLRQCRSKGALGRV